MGKGIFYSILTIIIMVPLLTLSSTYSEALRGYGTDIGSNVRMKSGLYFLNSVNEDFDRAVEIIGRRSMTACINKVIIDGNGLSSAENSILELFENSTLDGVPSDMVDYTIYEWMNKSDVMAGKRGFVLEREIRSIGISMEDPWNVMLTIDLRMKLGDKENLFYYEKNETRKVPVSIDGLEDPIYILNTGGRVTRKVDKSVASPTSLITSGSGGNGWGAGTSIKTGDPASVTDKDEKVLVVSSTSSSHAAFAGVVTGSNSTPLGAPYVLAGGWDNVPNSTRVVAEGTQGEVWDIQNLYDIHGKRLYVAGDGPSFLDRIEGSLVNTYPGAGLESLVDKDEILEKTGYVEDRSNVDYIYFNGASPNIYYVKGMPSKASWSFRIDEAHRARYGVDNTLSYT